MVEENNYIFFWTLSITIIDGTDKWNILYCIQHKNKIGYK